jgi:hypothetical protein
MKQEQTASSRSRLTCHEEASEVVVVLAEVCSLLEDGVSRQRRQTRHHDAQRLAPGVHVNDADRADAGHASHGAWC